MLSRLYKLKAVQILTNLPYPPSLQTDFESRCPAYLFYKYASKSQVVRVLFPFTFVLHVLYFKIASIY
jgi:hypothetical protein